MSNLIDHEDNEIYIAGNNKVYKGKTFKWLFDNGQKEDGASFWLIKKSGGKLDETKWWSDGYKKFHRYVARKKAKKKEFGTQIFHLNNIIILNAFYCFLFVFSNFTIFNLLPTEASAAPATTTAPAAASATEDPTRNATRADRTTPTPAADTAGANTSATKPSVVVNGPAEIILNGPITVVMGAGTGTVPTYHQESSETPYNRADNFVSL